MLLCAIFNCSHVSCFLDRLRLPHVGNAIAGVKGDKIATPENHWCSFSRTLDRALDLPESERAARGQPTIDSAGHRAARDKRATIVLIETGRGPVERWPIGINPVLLRVGALFSRQARVLVCPWHQVVLSAGAAVIEGPALAIEGDRHELISLPATQADAMWYYPVADATPIAQGGAERAALDRLLAAGGSPAETRSGVCAHLLYEASRLGLVTNSPGPLGRWGRKDQLEYALRWHTRTSRRNVARPRTFPVAGAQVPGAVDYFASRGLDCILKPANGARGEGIQIITANSAALPAVAAEDQFIVQELVTHPCVIDGFKTDLRVYIRVDSTDWRSSARLSPILVRKAAAPYAQMGDRAEITNTSYRRRHGLPARISPLADCKGLAADDARSIEKGVGALTQELLAAVHAWSLIYDRPLEPERGAPRVMIWGLDIVLTGPSGCRRPLLLEINVYPQLFRGDELCDTLIDAMLLDDFLPTFGRAGRTGPGRGENA